MDDFDAESFGESPNRYEKKANGDVNSEPKAPDRLDYRNEGHDTTRDANGAPQKFGEWRPIFEPLFSELAPFLKA